MAKWKLFSVNPRSGKQVRTLVIDESPSVPALVGNVVVYHGLMASCTSPWKVLLILLKSGQGRKKMLRTYAMITSLRAADGSCVWGGQDEQIQHMSDYSSLIAVHGDTGKQIWSNQVADNIMYPTGIVDRQVIVSNMKETITAYQAY